MSLASHVGIEGSRLERTIPTNLCENCIVEANGVINGAEVGDLVIVGGAIWLHVEYKVISARPTRQNVISVTAIKIVGSTTALEGVISTQSLEPVISRVA